MIKVSVVGASGYTGGELFRLLAGHPKVKLVGAHGLKSVGGTVSKLHPNLRGIVDLPITEPNYAELGKQVDLVFASTPHMVAMKFVPEVLKGGARVIDLSADYRFDDPSVYEKYYVKHESPKVKAVFGLPELHREQIKAAKLVANPGCFSTAAILELAPLVKQNLINLDHIIIDAKTGTSGAGASPTDATHHPTIGANVKAYSVTNHRHGPEINQELSKLAKKEVKAHFTPHLIPIVRGILSTAHVFLEKKMEQEKLLKVYQEFYSGEPFVRVIDELPQLNFVAGSNYCDIGLEAAPEGNRAVVLAAIDNLMKGASGQAVQNMNVMFGFDEREGIGFPAMRP